MKFNKILLTDALSIKELEMTELEQAFPVIKQLRPKRPQ